MKLLYGLTDVWQVYGEREYNISTMFMDNKFGELALDMKGVKINLNTAADNEQVLEIERQIRISKKRASSVWNTLLFNCLLNVVIIELIRQVVMWLNAFPVASRF